MQKKSTQKGRKVTSQSKEQAGESFESELSRELEKDFASGPAPSPNPAPAPNPAPVKVEKPLEETLRSVAHAAILKLQQQQEALGRAYISFDRDAHHARGVRMEEFDRMLREVERRRASYLEEDEAMRSETRSTYDRENSRIEQIIMAQKASLRSLGAPPKG